MLQKIEYDINRPWLTLDPWQKEYIYSEEISQDNFILCGRQSGKTAAMSMRAVELCVNHYGEGDLILINSITEKQAFRVLAKSLAYAEAMYPNQIKRTKEEKPTMHRLMFKNGSGILCYAAGDTGAGLLGFTIKKLMIDEGSRMSEEYFVAVMPMLSVTDGSMDIASTPNGKKHKDGSLRFFYKCSYDDNFKHYYISAEDCPRHSKEYLKKQKDMMSKLQYAQEYLAVFTDELRRIFEQELIDKCCIMPRMENPLQGGDYYLGVDVAGFGKDECTYEILEVMSDGSLDQRENIIERRNYTTDTSKKIITLNNSYDFLKIGVDDGGIGFGVFSELLANDETKRKIVALNNSSRI